MTLSASGSSGTPIPRSTTASTRHCEPSSSRAFPKTTSPQDTDSHTAACGSWSMSFGPRSARIHLPLFQAPKLGRPSHGAADPLIRPARAAIADVRTGSFQEETPPLQTRVAGLFVFWPLLTQLRFGELVEAAGYPGSGMVPATSALLSLLALKLIDKERRSHISDFDFDEALVLLRGSIGSLS
jgi:hypothetical protein